MSKKDDRIKDLEKRLVNLDVLEVENERHVERVEYLEEKLNDTQLKLGNLRYWRDHYQKIANEQLFAVKQLSDSIASLTNELSTARETAENAVVAFEEEQAAHEETCRALVRLQEQAQVLDDEAESWQSRVEDLVAGWPDEPVSQPSAEPGLVSASQAEFWGLDLGSDRDPKPVQSQADWARSLVSLGLLAKNHWYGFKDGVKVCKSWSWPWGWQSGIQDADLAFYVDNNEEVTVRVSKDGSK